MPILSNAKHELFSQGVAKGLDATEAYSKAGYKGGKTAASRLLTNVNVVDRIKELQGKASDKAVVDKAWVLQRLKENVETCMTMDFVKGPNGQPSTAFTHNPAAANKALELLGKELSMFKDQHEVTGKDGGPIAVKTLADFYADPKPGS